MTKTKQCRRCYKIKPLKELVPNSQMADNYENRCLECRTKDKREWDHMPENIEKRREYSRQYSLRVKNGEFPHRDQAQKMRHRNNRIVRLIADCMESGREGGVKEKTFLKNFGCSKKVFINRFERFFNLPENVGMGWHNYGAWHMDHIKPLKKFELLTKSSRTIANHYLNLRPTWGLNNMQKSSKYEMEQTI